MQELAVQPARSGDSPAGIGARFASDKRPPAADDPRCGAESARQQPAQRLERADLRLEPAVFPHPAMPVLPAGSPGPAQLHAGFRIEMVVARGMAAAVQHDGRHRLFAEPPPSLAQENARHPLFDGRGADPQFGVPAVQFVLLRALVLYAHADDVPRDDPRHAELRDRLGARPPLDGWDHHRYGRGDRSDALHRDGRRRGNHHHRAGGLPHAVLDIRRHRADEPASSKHRAAVL